MINPSTFEIAGKQVDDATFLAMGQRGTVEVTLNGVTRRERAVKFRHGVRVHIRGRVRGGRKDWLLLVLHRTDGTEEIEVHDPARERLRDAQFVTYSFNG